MELIGMSDYTLKQEKDRPNHWMYKSSDFSQLNTEFLSRCFNYANFLKMKLELWMFIPCDKEGNVLEDKGECSCSGNPEYCHGCNSYYYHSDKFKESDIYQEAKDRVIFEGQKKIEKDNSMYYNFQMENIDDNSVLVMRMVLNEEETHWHRVIDFNKFKTIEDLTSLGLTITPQAIKKYNLT